MRKTGEKKMIEKFVLVGEVFPIAVFLRHVPYPWKRRRIFSWILHMWWMFGGLLSVPVVKFTFTHAATLANTWLGRIRDMRLHSTHIPFLFISYFLSFGLSRFSGLYKKFGGPFPSATDQLALFLHHLRFTYTDSMTRFISLTYFFRPLLLLLFFFHHFSDQTAISCQVFLPGESFLTILLDISIQRMKRLHWWGDWGNDSAETWSQKWNWRAASYCTLRMEVITYCYFLWWKHRNFAWERS